MPVTYESIASQTLSSAAASITFSSIPATFTDLRIMFVGQTDSGALAFRLNSDTGTNYSNTYLYGDGSAAYSGRATNTSAGDFSIVSANPGGSIPVFSQLDIFSYSGSTFKTTLNRSSKDLNGNGAVAVACNLWRNTAAITNIQLLTVTGNLLSGTTATLYGIKNA